MDFALGLSDSRQNTVFKNNGDYSRTNLTANLGVELFKGLRLRSITQLAYTKTHNGSVRTKYDVRHQ
jgi:hypothetical protein